MKLANLKAVKRNDILGTDLWKFYDKNCVGNLNFIHLKREIACHIVIEIAIIGYCLFISVQSVAENISNTWLLIFTMLYICQWIGFLANAASINELGYHLSNVMYDHTSDFTYDLTYDLSYRTIAFIIGLKISQTF